MTETSQNDPSEISHPPTGSGLGEEFRIDSPERANWLVRRINEARAYGDHVREWAVKEQRRAEREERQLLHLFGRQLEMWVAKELAKHRGRRKTVRLPAGAVGFRRVGPKIVIEDFAAVLAWARTNCPEAIVTKEHVSRKAINAHAEQTGEIPNAGIKVEAERNALFVR